MVRKCLKLQIQLVRIEAITEEGKKKAFHVQLSYWNHHEDHIVCGIGVAFHIMFLFLLPLSASFFSVNMWDIISNHKKSQIGQQGTES